MTSSRPVALCLSRTFSLSFFRSVFAGGDRHNSLTTFPDKWVRVCHQTSAGVLTAAVDVSPDRRGADPWKRLNSSVYAGCARRRLRCIGGGLIVASSSSCYAACCGRSYLIAVDSNGSRLCTQPRSRQPGSDSDTGIHAPRSEKTSTRGWDRPSQVSSASCTACRKSNIDKYRRQSADLTFFFSISIIFQNYCFLTVSLSWRPIALLTSHWTSPGQ